MICSQDEKISYGASPKILYEVNASYLKSKGYIAEFEQQTLSDGGIYITPEGFDLVEKTELLSSAVDQIFVNTRTLVDAGLAQMAPAAPCPAYPAC